MDKNRILKKYRLKINPKDGAIVDFISQVEDPAIEVGFLKFNKQQERFTVNEDKQEIFGPVLIPDQLIYRNSESLGDYYVFFKAEDIKEIAMNFMKSGYQNNVNLDHSNTMADSYVYESFISSELVPNPEPFKDLPLGTWFARMKVDNKDVWNDIKSGKRTGYSIEGMFEYIIDEFEKHKSDTTIYIETQDKNIIKQMFKNLFKKALTELAEEMGNDFQKVQSADYKIANREVGQKVEVVAPDESLTNAPDGSYEFEDGFKFTVKDGLIESIEGQETPKEEEPKEEQAAVETPVEDKKEGQADPKELEDLKSTVADLQKQIDEIKSMFSNVPTAESMSKEFEEIKLEFKSVFEKFTKIPAEESKVVNSNVVKDANKKKFEEFVASLKK